MKRFGIPGWLSLSVPVLVGVVVMSSCQAPMARWGVHSAAGLLGLAIYGLLTTVRWQPSRSLLTLLVLTAVMSVASTLLWPGIDGMRRWHMLGPLRVHPSAMLVPILLVFAAEQLRRHRLAVHALVVGLQAVHFAQPDAGQATALGFGMIGLLLSDSRQRFKALFVCSYLLTIAGTWLRFDPLPPAMFVEDIVPRAFALTPIAGVVALASLALFVLSPLLSGRGRGPIAPAAALVGCFAGSLVGASFGEFPVPLLGFGTSPTIGAFLGLAAFRRLQLESSDTQDCGAPQSHRKSRASGRQVQPNNWLHNRFVTLAPLDERLGMFTVLDRTTVDVLPNSSLQLSKARQSSRCILSRLKGESKLRAEVGLRS